MQKEVEENIDKFYYYLKHQKKYSENTITAYIKDITYFYEYLKCDIKLNNDDISKYLVHLYNDLKLSKSSIGRKLSSLRSFYNYLLREEIININYFEDVSNPKKPLLLPKYLKDDEVNKIFSVCMNNDNISIRDRVIIELLYSSGIRVSELVNIKLLDINFKDKEIKVLGKGEKERIVMFNDSCMEALKIFINEVRPKIYKKENGYLFIGRNNGHMSAKSIRDILNKIRIKAGLEEGLHPHLFRHTFATDMLNNGADLVSVKELLGHESLNTTSIYTHVSDEHIRKIYDMAHPRAKKE